MLLLRKAKKSKNKKKQQKKQKNSKELSACHVWIKCADYREQCFVYKVISGSYNSTAASKEWTLVQGFSLSRIGILSSSFKILSYVWNIQISLTKLCITFCEAAYIMYIWPQITHRKQKRTWDILLQNCLNVKLHNWTYCVLGVTVYCSSVWMLTLLSS